jgi:hypothetical protein
MHLRYQNPEAFEVTDAIVRSYYDIGEVVINPTSLEKWNLDGTNTPKADGTWDVDGHSSCDITAEYYFPWWEHINRKAFVSRFKSYLSDVKEMVWDMRSIKNIPEWVFKFHPLSTYHSRWVWVLDSKACVCREAAFEKAYTRDTKKSIPEIEKGINDLLSDHAMRESLFEQYLKENGYIKYTHCMWVQETDPTVFIVDEQYVPFTLKDGWADKDLPKIISLWFREMYGTTLYTRLGDVK